MVGPDMTLTFIENENDEYCSWRDIYETKEAMYDDFKDDAGIYAAEFWGISGNWKIRDDAVEFGVDYVLKDASWITYWESALKDYCKNILCYITPNHEMIDYDDKELKEVWDNLGETVAKETLEKFIALERLVISDNNEEN